MEIDTPQKYQPPPPPPQAPLNQSSDSTATTNNAHTNNNYYTQQQQQQQQQQFESIPSSRYEQPVQFQQDPVKPNIPHIQPLIDPHDSMPPNADIFESPTIGFIGGGNINQTEEYSAYNENDSSSSPTRSLNLRYQLFLDKISPHWKARWAFSLFALTVFMARVVIAQGWYVICYALAIYYLNLLIGFISPKVDPGLGMGDDDDLAGPMLPTSANDEFKPFIRRVPEFKFWISGTKATLISLFLSLFDIFDVPVFWPILLIYFIILFACTMRQQIRHMIRYSYVPWDSGKKRYAGRNSDSTSNLYPETV